MDSFSILSIILLRLAILNWPQVPWQVPREGTACRFPWRVSRGQRHSLWAQGTQLSVGQEKGSGRPLRIPSGCWDRTPARVLKFCSFVYLRSICRWFSFKLPWQKSRRKMKWNFIYPKKRQSKGGFRGFVKNLRVRHILCHFLLHTHCWDSNCHALPYIYIGPYTDFTQNTKTDAFYLPPKRKTYYVKDVTP